MSRINVTVFAPSFSDSGSTQNVLYQEKVLQFDVMLNSSIKVDPKFRKGIELNKETRTVDIKITSNDLFNVQAINLNEEDRGLDLIKFRVNKSVQAPNEYYLTVTVPREITYDFKT